MMNVKTAFCYCRVSSGRQKTEKGGYGMSRQQALLTSYIEEYEDKDGLGYKLSVDHMVFLNAEGVSGFSGKNIELGSVLHTFITDYKNGKIRNAVLIIENADRFSRANPNEAAELFLGLINSGCNIHEIDTETVHHRFSDLNQISSGLSRSHKESLRKQKLSLKNWDKRFDQTIKEKVPLTGKCPGWLRVENNKYIEIANRTAPIRLIFEWYNNGFGQSYIRDKLNSEGFRYNDKTWSDWSVHRVLKDERVTGKHKTQSSLRGAFDGIVIYPVIISDMDFKRAEQRLTKPGRDKKINRRANNVFSGLLICGVCKKAHILITNEKGKRYGRCSYAVSGNERCTASGFKYNIIEETLLKHLRHLDFSKLNHTDHANELEALENELVLSKGYLYNVQEIIDKDDIPTERDYKIFKNLQVKTRELENKINSVKAIGNVGLSYHDISNSINDELFNVNNIVIRQEFNIKIRRVIRNIEILKVQHSIVFVCVEFYASDDKQWLTINLKDGSLLSNTYIENDIVGFKIIDGFLKFDNEKNEYSMNGELISHDEAFFLFKNEF